MASKPQGGFVLFEVLVAAAILSTGCLILVESLQGSSRAMRHVQDSYEAALNAANLLWIMERTPDTAEWKTLLSPGSLRDLQWTTELKSLSFDGLKTTLEARTVTMRWQPAGPSRPTDHWSLTGYSLHEDTEKS